ncbi:hypothetical protein [Flavobacterium limi]|uniref:GLPGLI family protein n=1 Tax=Flavobacterium limi TaxID=2045105 RepID=A0ABQ1TP12_9FLAO|nr:hypothetical protein [Flavobacterium limi]GGE98269.1 hypothetical protein GCM10011518_04620 [Flavobacterium limi]
MKVILYSILFLSFSSFSQEIPIDDPVNKLYLPTAKQNTVDALIQYKGKHACKSVYEYKFVDEE